MEENQSEAVTVSLTRKDLSQPMTTSWQKHKAMKTKVNRKQK